MKGSMKDIKPIIRIFYIVLGLLSAMLGLVGIIVPLLPTTPFLLLASYFFIHSSKRLHAWLLNHRIFGRYLNQYITYRAISRKAKIIALIFLWTSLLISMSIMARPFVSILLLLIGTAVSIHLLMLKTIV